MKNKISLISYTSFIIFIILLILEIFITENKINSYGTNVRSIKVILSYFVHLPLFILNLILSIKVFIFYYKHNFKKPLKALFFVLPSIIFYICWIIYFIIGVTR
jgi:hypothetical protein